MDYQNLKKIFHRYSQQNWENEYQMRFNHFSTFKTNIIISPIQDESQKLSIKYPIFISNTRGLVAKVEKVALNSKIIKELSLQLPGIASSSFFKNLLINEAQSTNETENIRSTKQEIADALNDKNDKNKKFHGLVSQYVLLDENQPLIFNNVSDFRDIYNYLVADDIEKKDILDGDLFRKKGVGVYNESTGKWIHRNEFTEAEIYEFLTNLRSFYNNDDIPIIYRIIAGHYLFEYLHPFYDGNGRVGRYIVAHMLADHLDKYTAMTFSYTVNRNQNKYYKAFENASNFYNKGELTEFISDMLDLLLEGQDRVLKQLSDNAEMWNALENGLSKLNLSNDEFNVLSILIQDRVFGSKYTKVSLNQICEFLGITRYRLKKVIENHKDKVTQIKKRPSTYVIEDSFIEEIKVLSL